MAEPVFIMRGLTSPSPFSEEVLRQSTDMQADLKAVAGLPQEQVLALKKRLSEAEGFLDLTKLRAIVREVVADDKTAQSVWTTLWNLQSRDVEQALRLFQEKGAKKDFPFDDSVIGRLKTNLPALIRSYPALDRFRKAERVASLTGQRLESIQLVCDLRPVFNDARDEIEGMMPYTRLRMVATGADGLPDAFEVELTHQQVRDLADKAGKAAQKLNVLRQHIERSLPGGLPDLPLTHASREGSADA